MKNNDFFKGRKIALIGNAKNVLNTLKIINTKFDIICRINAGFPQGKEKYIGSRTDVLFLSSPLSEKAIKRFGAIYIIWCTPKREYMTEYIDRNSLKFGLIKWSLLYSKLGNNRPSTGIMAFEYLLDKEFESLTLIGFDFWQSPTWYTNTIRPAHHSPKDEERYIKDKIKEYKGKIILKK